jgi:hypothetical protein
MARVPRRPLAAVLAGLAAAALAACAADRPGSDAPRFSLTLRAVSTDLRYTYFELDRKGNLAFGGGKNAVISSAKPVITLTDDQRREVWQIIAAGNLLDAPSKPFAKGERVTYDLSITREGMALGRNVHNIDDNVPAIKQLHDYLFGIQAEKRYKIQGLKEPTTLP